MMMRIDELVRYLDDAAAAQQPLCAWGLDDPRRGHANLVNLAQAGLTLDLLADLCTQLSEHLPRLSDPDRALNNLERFVLAQRSPLALGALFERDRAALPILLQILSTSQHLADLLVSDPQAYDLLRQSEGQPVTRDTLLNELASEVAALNDESAVLAELRRFKRRETLRIAYGDIVRGQRLSLVTEQISFLADAIIESAVRFARRKLSEKRGPVLRADGEPNRFVVLALGKLGGGELNYSSDVDLIFLYETDERARSGTGPSPVEYFERLARDVVRLLAETTPLGQAYRVDLRLRPGGSQGPLVHGLDQAWRYYDLLGRTWERQAFVKARSIAGDVELGRAFLARLESWVYRRYLSLADITGIKALKRRIEQRALREGIDHHDVKNGRGGIRDIEFVIQFLQLLNGGDLPTLRCGNTLDALPRLESAGCLTAQERNWLEDNYSFLRKIEHWVQIMFDLQTHLLPSDADELRRLALRMGYVDAGEQSARETFEQQYLARTAQNRQILDHLLHDAFGDDPQTEPEVDLVLDPDPPAERVREVLAPYPFKAPELAYRNLQTLAEERIRFLSTRRCRHFLASIAPRLLHAVAQTPDPDSTLTTLANVSDSLGGKGVLWELFSFNPPSLQWYVEVCSRSPLLAGLLTSNPGMIDELMDSLVLNRLPTRTQLQAALAEVSRGAEDLDPIWHSFKNTQVLNVGVRDILGKEDVFATTSVLADLADVCLEQIALTEFERLKQKWGEPLLGEGPRAGEPCGWSILALGKLGGRELTYHSDLDVLFLYEADGLTTPSVRTRRSVETTTNQHFFSELGQRIMKTAARVGPLGKLYNVDPRLRPTGRNGPLATSLGEFIRYYAAGHGQTWERLALCKARRCVGAEPFAAQVLQACQEAAYSRALDDADVLSIREMRLRLEAADRPANIKRGAGGIADIEFVAQMLQLRHGHADPSVRCAGTLDALLALHEAGYLNGADYESFAANYRFLRRLESRIRLMNTIARDDLPDDPIDLQRLARGLDLSDGAAVVELCERTRRQNRQRFETMFSSTPAAV